LICVSWLNNTKYKLQYLPLQSVLFFAFGSTVDIPIGQPIQDPWPSVSWYQPLLQSMHLSRVELWYVPTGQATVKQLKL
jgi:hypothetical protein